MDVPLRPIEFNRISSTALTANSVSARTTRWISNLSEMMISILSPEFNNIRRGNFPGMLTIFPEPNSQANYSSPANILHRWARDNEATHQKLITNVDPLSLPSSFILDFLSYLAKVSEDDKQLSLPPINTPLTAQTSFNQSENDIRRKSRNQVNNTLNNYRQSMRTVTTRVKPIAPASNRTQSLFEDPVILTKPQVPTPPAPVNIPISSPVSPPTRPSMDPAPRPKPNALPTNVKELIHKMQKDEKVKPKDEEEKKEKVDKTEKDEKKERKEKERLEKLEKEEEKKRKKEEEEQRKKEEKERKKAGSKKDTPQADVPIAASAPLVPEFKHKRALPKAKARRKPPA